MKIKLALFAVVLLNGCASHSWEPTVKTDPITFLSNGEKPIPVIQLLPNGALIVSIPDLYKEWEKQTKANKAAEKKVEPKK